MALIRASDQIENIREDKEKFRYIQLYLQDNTNQVNGGLEILKNLRQSVVSATFTSANTDTTFNHSLNSVPNGFIVIWLSAAMTVYNGSINASNTQITLRSSAVGTAQVLLF